jgi:glycosyltransferase involved in cell wall biosynthesis
MKVSVAMATYNGTPFLAGQFASIVRQDRMPDELVISDDGSSDGTGADLREFALAAPFPVTVLRNPARRGVQSNVQHALSQTSGDVILLAGQDDVWQEQHISSLVTALETDPELLVAAGDSVVMDTAGTLQGYTLRDREDVPPALVRATNLAAGAEQFRRVLGHHAVSGHSMAFRRRVLEVALPLPSTWGHDQWIFLIGAAMGRVTYLPSVISRHRLPDADESEEVRGLAEGATGDSWRELARWQDLLTRLERSRSALRFAETALADARSKVSFMGFRAGLREQALPVRTVRIAGRLLTGRYHRLARGIHSCAADLSGRRG